MYIHVCVYVYISQPIVVSESACSTDCKPFYICMYINI